VTVAKRLPNGNLLVRGEKWIGINQGREFVRVSGIIRPIDIEPDNSVPSSKVANARSVWRPRRDRRCERAGLAGALLQLAAGCRSEDLP
jgi:hypothetical protein